MAQTNARSTRCRILLLHLAVSIFVFIAASAVVGIWYLILSQPSDIEDAFTTSETLQLLQIIIGFTYIGVIRSFFDSLERKTSLIANITMTFDSKRYQSNRQVINKFFAFIEGALPEKVNRMHSMWKYWSDDGLDESWRPIFKTVVLINEVDHGQLFSWLGPWMALAVFYLFHPPVAYREDQDILAWGIIYAVSITILFSFLCTMWIVEKNYQRPSHSHSRGIRCPIINQLIYESSLSYKMHKAVDDLKQILTAPLISNSGDRWLTL